MTTTMNEACVKRTACELAIVKCLTIMGGEQHHINILNNILSFHVSDELTPVRNILKNAYSDIIETYPSASIGKIYKDLELRATDLRNGRGKFYNQPMLKSDSPQGMWELINN